ncbi:MAG: hypothetical protein KGY54_11055 [Oleiphilaceae bacterium]|nr:hypothetical protein [Oleiphilaceae bacterium]
MSIARSLVVGSFITISIAPGLALSKSQSGLVEVLYWDDISGTKVSELTAHPDYPQKPHEVIEITSLDSPRNRGDNFGALVRGYIEPPLDGDYRFHISGDDETQFFLSSTEQPDNGELIANVPGWTNVGEFDKYSSQISESKTLENGQRYYFEIRFKEGGGSDHFSIAWEGPGFARSIVPSSALYSWAPPEDSPDMSIAEAYHLGYRAGFLDAGAANAFDPSFPMKDQDGDGIYDNWELAHGLDPTDPADAQSDPDGDLLVAYDEFFLGTAEGNPDTDGDGIPDGVEVSNSLDPLDSADAEEDMDGDGFTNLEEYNAGTDLQSADETPEVTDENQEYLAGFVSQYFRGVSFDELVVVKNDAMVDFDWGDGSPSDLPSDDFSARWASEFVAPHDEGTIEYRFTTRTDDGVRLFLAGQLVIDVWQNQGATSYSYDVALEPGESVPVAMEYYEKGGNAVAQLSVVDKATGTSVNYENVFRVTDPNGTNSTDTDQDGLPDTWELNHGTNVWVADGDDVLNSSDVTNLEAYESGLDPRTLESTETDSDSSTSDETVSDPDAALATLTWTAPLTREDGSSLSLSEIDHYLVNYGQDSSELTRQVQIASDATNYEFNELESGDWYFSIQVVDREGLVSVPSDQASKSIL